MEKDNELHDDTSQQQQQHQEQLRQHQNPELTQQEVCKPMEASEIFMMMIFFVFHFFIHNPMTSFEINKSTSFITLSHVAHHHRCVFP
jgi:hypothetical protein